MRQYDPEWTVDVLDDLREFFEANDMMVSSERTRGLIDVVKSETQTNSQLLSLSEKTPKRAS